MFTLPLTDTSSSNSALPVVKNVPPTEVLPAILTAPLTDTASSNIAAPATVTVDAK